MARGGMVENEDLDPSHEPRSDVKDEMLKQFDFSHEKQDHGQLPQPAEEYESDREYAKANSPQRYSKYGPEGMYPQDHQSEPMQKQAYYKDGGMIKAVMKKRMMAKGGLLEDDGTQPAESHDVYPKKGFNESGNYDMDRDEFFSNESGDYDFDRHPHAWDKESEDDVNYADGGVVESEDPEQKKMKRKSMISRLMLKHG